MKPSIAGLILSLSLIVAGCSPSEDAFTKDEFQNVSPQIMDICRTWFRSRPQNYSDQPYNVFLVIDTDVPAIWLERNGQVSENETCELPASLQWEILHVTPEGERHLQSPVRLKQRSDKFQDDITQEQLFVRGFQARGNAGMHFTITNSGSGTGWGNVKKWQYSWGPKPDKPDAVDQSYLVTPEEYSQSNPDRTVLNSDGLAPSD